MIEVDVAIVGGGPAGLAAAQAAHEEGAKRILILERDSHLGGILQQCIHNGFGLHYFKEELTGPEYAERFVEKLSGTGVRVSLDTMVLEISRERIITAVSPKEGLMQVKAGAIVLAMGCRERTRGALNIPGARPSGVFTAGCAQRLINMEGYMPGRTVVILGSGDIGLIMARRMTWEGAKVRMVCEIMPYSSGLTRNIVQCLEDNDIPLRYEYTVTRVHGDRRVTGVTVAKVDQNRRPIPETEEFVECDTLLLSVGLIPENEVAQGLDIEMDPVTQGAVVDENRETTAAGVFACGNVLHVHDLVDNVSLEAGIAGRAAAKFAAGRLPEEETVSVRPGEGVRYVVPQRIRRTAEGCELFFRVGDTKRNVNVVLQAGDTILQKRRRPIVKPGEMESMRLKEVPCASELTVKLEEV
ncbi:NAD(P)/FAD-dependent oxidoreductase [Gehongia tenuis]|uniref:FAD-dependent oxidoreductase n=1 Tax=Gehongia tenuis TaxID=2763655 RepID=A0A926D3T0_9FIRM|nr:FAD-dependent oxidoreductase [Gehongia tenuis]MBC8530934.1 FAD-dependent oxidoreductase [Gehongia tenuis]